MTNVLRKLNDQALLNSTRMAVAKERSMTMWVLRHLMEIERRKLYSDLKYSSLFDYTVRELKYSEGAAGRRVQTVRLLRELPELESKIESGTLSLTNVCLAQRYFRETKSTRQAELALIKLRGSRPLPRERIISEDLTEFTFLADRELKELLLEVRSLVGPKGSNLSLAEFVREMALCTRDKHTTQRFGKKRAQAANTDAESDSTYNSGAGVHRSRYIPKSVKDHVWKKANGKCECCGSQQNLEYEHIIPFALGGTSTPDNLRRGVKTFGTHAMRRDAPPC